VTTAKERRFQMGFQGLDLLANSRLRNVEFLSRPRKAQVPRRGLEDAKLVEVRKRAGDTMSQRFSPA